MNLADIGGQLKTARVALKLSQSELAGRLGMSRSTISALEGKRCSEIGIAKLTALLDMVGLELTVGPRRSRPTIDDLRAERRR